MDTAELARYTGHIKKMIQGGVFMMTVRERLLAIRLMEKEAKMPAYTEKIGVHIYMKELPGTAIAGDKERKNV